MIAGVEDHEIPLRNLMIQHLTPLSQPAANHAGYASDSTSGRSYRSSAGSTPTRPSPSEPNRNGITPPGEDPPYRQSLFPTSCSSQALPRSSTPALAGLIADAVSKQRLSLEFHWTSSDAPRGLVTALDLAGLDFLFVLAVFFGLYSLHRLLVVREEGEIDDVVAAELYREVRRAVRHVSNVAGLRRLTTFPFGILTQSRGEKRDETDDSP